MDGAFNGYLPYSQQQPPQPPQSQLQQSQQGGPQSSHPSPSAAGAHHHQSHQQHHSGLSNYGPIPGQHASDSPTHPTLPPLQSQNPYPQFGQLPYGHAGHQSHTPPGSHTPVSSSMGNSNGYSHQPPSMMPPTSYNQPYGLSPSIMYPSSTASSMTQSAATAGLPTIRPMPPGGVSTSMNGLSSLASAGHLGQQPSFMQTEDSPTHVVGSQGRRGILPSAPGRPNPPPQGSGISTKSMIPAKDADGKFPCPHCNKTYLHAKHLKRHLLRHTGDRPYMCHLCKDTFSRSDILKRHFQKCSIRRGNPTGANHLAHQRRPTNSSNRLSMGQQDSPIGLAGMADAAVTPYNPANVVNNSPSASEMSTRSSRANSLIGANNMTHRNGMAGLGIMPTSGTNGEQMGSSASYQPGMSSYAMSTPPNGSMSSNYAFSNQSLNGSGYNTPTQPMSFLGHPSSRFNNHPSNNPHISSLGGEDAGNHIDWTRMFAAGVQDGFVGSQSANASSETNDVKLTPSTSKSLLPNTHPMTNDITNESFLGDLYSHPDAFGSEYSKKESTVPGFSNWTATDPLSAKVEALKQFSLGQVDAFGNPHPGAEILQACLSVDNVRLFAECFLGFQQHWPILHLPTFKFTDAKHDLNLAIICVGVLYSQRLHPLQTRQLMEFVQLRVLSQSTIYGRILGRNNDSLGYSSQDMEELQALIILQILFMWHGDTNQRQAARKEFATISQIVRAMGLLQSVMPGHYAYSILHVSPGNSAVPVNVYTFNWSSWVEQEKRNRLLYSAFVVDASMAMFFNARPHFDPLEICVPLPSDENAWDAKDTRSCVDALGLDEISLQNGQTTGAHRPQQLIMRDALRILLDPANIMPVGATNAYSKFVLVHALIVRIIACQKDLFQVDSPALTFNTALGGSGPATPLSQNDWLDQHGTNGSGYVTPTDGMENRLSLAVQHDKKRLGHALDKLRRTWDIDMNAQYSITNVRVPQRVPYQAAAILFNLGRSFLQSQSALDWTVPADVRFKQVLGLLKHIRGFVEGNQSRVQDLSPAGDSGIPNGSHSLMLDMKVLFPGHVV